MINIAATYRTLLQLEFCTVFPRLEKLTVYTLELFADDELIKTFLRGFLSDERVHGVPLDALPPEIRLSFDIERKSVEEIAGMVAFCTAMQCNTERHSVSVLQAQRTPSGGSRFQ